MDRSLYITLHIQTYIICIYTCNTHTCEQEKQRLILNNKKYVQIPLKYSQIIEFMKTTFSDN